VGFLFQDPRFSNQYPLENGFRFHQSGQITWVGAGQSVNLQPFTAGQTYVLRAEIDLVNETARVFVNGVLRGDDLPAWPRVIPASSPYGVQVPLDQWGVSESNFPSGTSLTYFDDVWLGL
jgi:hypothetical protein